MGKHESKFRIIHPHAAGIDLGSRSHMVAVDQVKGNVQEFGVYTKDHEELITHLYACGVTTIAWRAPVVIGKLCSMPCRWPALKCCWC